MHSGEVSISKTDPAAASSVQIVGGALESLLDVTPLESVIAIAAQSTSPSTPFTTLMHVRLAENKANTVALASYLWKSAINYALSRRRRLAIRKLIEDAPPGDLSGIAAPHAAARNAFIEFNEKYPARASEVGEVLAYCTALSQLKAAQVAAKMSLKTSANMPVHGLDGIHANVENGSLVVYFLESKLNQSANGGAKDYAESVADFMTGKKQYLLEYAIVGDLGNLDTLEGEERELALKFFDVLEHPEVPRKERSVALICYPEDKLFAGLTPVAAGQPSGFHETEFQGAYAKLLSHHQDAALKHLTATGVDPNKCFIFFVAVPDVAELRKLFYEQMGYSPKAAA